jgi:hypothetical protein
MRLRQGQPHIGSDERNTSPRLGIGGNAGEYISDWFDIGILGVDIEQVPTMRTLGSISHAFHGDDGAISVRDRVDRRCANATAGDTTNHNQRVDPSSSEKRQDGRAEKSGGGALDPNRFVGEWLEPFIDFAQD